MILSNKGYSIQIQPISSLAQFISTMFSHPPSYAVLNLKNIVTVDYLYGCYTHYKSH